MNTFRIIQLSSGSAHAIVDPWAFEFLSQWNWQVSEKGYARRSVTFDGKTSLIWMHRVICGAPSHAIVDHVNKNTLDNRMVNLRLANASGNNRNRKPNAKRALGIRYKGVYRNTNCGTFYARISHKINGSSRTVYLGSFTSAEDAARAYDEAAIRLHGEFAQLNLA
jgi:hypothetical protein